MSLDEHKIDKTILHDSDPYEDPEDDFEDQEDEEEAEETTKEEPEAETEEEPKQAESESKQERRRKERQQKGQKRRMAQERDRQHIQRLRESDAAKERRIQELEARINGIAHSSQISEVDRAISDAQARISSYTAIKKEALEQGESGKVIAADDALYEEKNKLHALRNYKENSSTRRQPAEEQEQRKEPTTLDRQRGILVKSKATQWANKTGFSDWSPSDRSLALDIDTQIKSEGFDDTEDDYYEELSKRTQKYLPHRFEQKQSVSKPKARPTTAGGGDMSAVSSSSDKGIPREAIAAWKQAGMYETPEQQKRMRENYLLEVRKHK